jgi:hypothetical protein
MLKTYTTADKAILESMGEGLIVLCLPTEDNVDELERQCDRWQDDGSVVRFISDLHGWTVVVVKTKAARVI